MATLDVSSGVTATDELLSKGEQKVYSGGITSKMIIQKKGKQLILTDGSAFETIINNGGSQTVSAGTATSTHINKGGTQVISSGGSVSETTVFNGGSQVIIAGGSANQTTVKNGGNLIVGEKADSAKSIEELALEAGGKIYSRVNKKNYLVFSANKEGSLTGATIVQTSGAYLSIGSDATATKIAVNGGKKIDGGILFVGEGGQSSETVINNGGSECVGGGSAEGSIVKDGGLQLITAGEASKTTILKGGLQEVSAGKVTDTIVSGGTQIIYGGEVSGTTIKNGMQIISGGSVTDTTIGSGGTIIGAATNATITKGGTQFILNETADSTTVNAGRMVIIDKSDYIDIAATGVTINSGGTVAYYKTDQELDYKKLNKLKTTTLFSAGKNGSISNVTFNRDGTMIVGDGAVVSTFTILKGASQCVSDGSVTNAIVNLGGIQDIQGGTVTSSLINKGAVQIVSGGEVTGTIVKKRGEVHLGADDASVTDMIVSNGGLLYKSDNTLHGKVENGGLLSNITFGNDTLTIDEEAAAKKYSLLGNAELLGGTANKITINSAASMTVNAGLIQEATVKNGGTLSFEENGSGTIINVDSGGILQKSTDDNASPLATVEGKIVSASFKNGSLIIGRGATASKCTFSLPTEVSSGGKIIKSVINGESDETVLTVSNKGILSSATLTEGNVLVKSGGQVTDVEFGGGKIQLEGGTLSDLQSINSTNIGFIEGQGQWYGKKSLTIGDSDEIKNDDLALTVNAKSLHIAGNTTLQSISGKTTTTTGFDISEEAPNELGTVEMNLLAATDSSEHSLKTNVTINASELQNLGSYKLTENVLLAGKFTVVAGKTSISGSINKNASKNGVTYSLTEDGTLTLTPYASTNKILKSTKEKSSLTGTDNSDVFYGCGSAKGGNATNDTITGKNGRDVVVYETNAWGKDVIKATNGAMTLVFNGIAEDNVEQSVSGNTCTITRKGCDDSITIQGYDASKHNIKWNAAIGNAFTEWAQATSPSTDQTKAAHAEVWKAAGLTAS